MVVSEKIFEEAPLAVSLTPRQALLLSFEQIK